MRLIFRTLTLLFAVMLLASGLGSAYAADTSADEHNQRIKANELKALVDNGETVLIVDVRSAEEFMEVHITGALSVPLHQVEAKLAGLSPKTKIAFY